MKDRDLYLAAYDISSPRRLRAALHLVRAYATGGQKSVHECFLTASERGGLLLDMAQVLDEEQDSFLLLRLDPRAHVLTAGVASTPVEQPFFYFG
jgi:CRISPR-associated protein Cas2